MNKTRITLTNPVVRKKPSSTTKDNILQDEINYTIAKFKEWVDTIIQSHIRRRKTLLTAPPPPPIATTTTTTTTT